MSEFVAVVSLLAVVVVVSMVLFQYCNIGGVRTLLILQLNRELRS